MTIHHQLIFISGGLMAIGLFNAWDAWKNFYRQGFGPSTSTCAVSIGLSVWLLFLA